MRILAKSCLVSAFALAFLAAQSAYGQWCGGGGGGSSGRSGGPGGAGGSGGAGSGGGSNPGGTTGRGASPGSTGQSGPTGSIGWVNGTPVVPVPQTPTGQATTGPQTGPKEPGIAETESAARRGMPALLYFFWPVKEDAAGQACEEFSARVFVDGRVVDLAKQYVCIRVNGKTCPKVVLGKYGIAKFPTIVFMTCTQKLVSSVSTVEMEPEKFAELMTSVTTANKKTLEMLEAKRGQLKALLGKGDEAKDKGRYQDAVRAYERVIAISGGDPLELDAKLKIQEVKMIGIFEEGEKLYKAEKYEEARGRLQVVADFELSCQVRDRARALLPDCDMAAEFGRAVTLRKSDPLAAIEALGKIVANEDYEGCFKAKAVEMIAEIKGSWGNKVGSH